MVPELRSVTTSSDDRSLPDDPTNCRVFVTAIIGPRGALGEELFHLEVVTRSHTDHAEISSRPKRVLVVDEFSWLTVETFLLRLLANVEGDTWQQVVAKLSNELEWEFDGYQPHKA